jgi:negative regulator of flagellin synthesis FlgM
MQVHGSLSVHGPQAIPSPHSGVRGPSESSAPRAPVDELQLSDAARFVEAARDLPEVRQERINEIRRQLVEGTYDIDSRLDVAVDRLLDELA